MLNKKNNTINNCQSKIIISKIQKVNYKERRSHGDEGEQNILNDKNLMAALKALSNE